MPRSPAQAKGLLLAAIACNDPVLFLEPKVLYRAAVELVPREAYQIPLSKAEIVKEGKDVTIVSYGHPLYTCSAAIEAAEKDFGMTIELLDLRTLYPWDRKTVLQSVKKTGRAVVVHESMVSTFGPLIAPFVMFSELQDLSREAFVRVTCAVTQQSPEIENADSEIINRSMPA